MTWLGANTIETYTGRSYDFLQPDPAEIVLTDIAQALGNACRFAGHTRKFYSVAEHSILVSRIVEAWVEPDRHASDVTAGRAERLIDAALFHDAHEAYVWDAPRPIKPLLGFAFAELADNADWAVGQAFGIDPALFHHPLVKRADDALLLHEGYRLMRNGPGAGEDLPPLPIEIPGLGLLPAEAHVAFIRRAKERGFTR